MAKKNKMNKVSSILGGNYIEPKGNVIVKITKQDKIIRQFTVHNAATLALCTYLRDALYGDYVIASKPGKIRICSLNGTELSPIQNTPFFPLVSIDKEVADNVVSLYFKLPYDSIQGKDIEGLMLYADNASIDDEPYAKVKFEIPIRASSNSNVRIEWQLIVVQKGA